MSKIAIIGSSGLFPGSSNPNVFWENLVNEKNNVSLATAKDFEADPKTFFHKEKGKVDHCSSLKGGYIRDFKFDPSGFQIPSAYVEQQDKMYQWSLHVAREALKDSSYFDNKEILKKCGVVLGNLSFPTSSSYHQLSPVFNKAIESGVQKLIKDQSFKLDTEQRFDLERKVIGSPSQMVSEAVGLGAIYYELDAACASSLYAIKLACDELITGKADMMLAGAVCASYSLFIHMGFSIFQAYAGEDKKFAPFDKDSDGLISSEGAGMVVLKRLEDAVRDQDNILGLVGSVGLSNDGSGKFLLSPNPKGQQLAFERAYQKEHVLPKNTSYIECHATGTPLGDITELNSISNFFVEHDIKPMLGSIKSNMGHSLTAAGMAGLLKVLASINKNKIPPNINLNESVLADNRWMGKAQMITEMTPWAGANKQAGINSFGFGGTNAHMVIQNYKPEETPKPTAIKEIAPLSIIGMDAHFGGCTNLDDFYSSIFYGKQYFKELPNERWKGFDENTELLKTYGFADGKAPRGAYIDAFEIDLIRYKIQPNELKTLEPQQALILKVADNAIKDAGLKKGQNVAVLIAMEPELSIHKHLARWHVSGQLKRALEKTNISLTEKQLSALEKSCKDAILDVGDSQTPSEYTSFVGNIMASRVAALWDFTGPAFTVSSGENSVFKALEIAQNLISLGEVDAVVVGGVDFSGGIENVLLRNQTQKVNKKTATSLSLNEGEECSPIGEGGGAIVLKNKKHLTKEEKIYAHIDHVGELKPTVAGSYIELAATGSETQDEEEIVQLLKNKPAKPVALGSVKANIGNTYAASGIASLIKTALCIHHKFIPGIPNWTAPKDTYDFSSSEYYFPTESRPWIPEGANGKREAIVNGIDGIQVCLSEAISEAPRAALSKSNSFLNKNLPALILIKGDTEEDLMDGLASLEIAIRSEDTVYEIAQHFYRKTSQKKHQFCAVLLSKTKEQLVKEVLFFKRNFSQAISSKTTLKTPLGSYFTAKPFRKNSKIAFMYPGSFTAYEGLGQELFQLFPQLFDSLGASIDNLDQYMHPSQLFPPNTKSSKNKPTLAEDTLSMMSTGAFFSVCYTKVLKDLFKIKPDIAFGYSLGECSSMWYAFDVWAHANALQFKKSPIFKKHYAGDLKTLADHWGISTTEAKENWVSLILLASKAAVEPLIANEDKVYLTFVNTQNEVIISGDKSACESIVAQLGCDAMTVPFQSVVHHDFCKTQHQGLFQMHDFEIKEIPDTDFYSSYTQKKVNIERKAIAENSAQVCYTTVDFPKTVENVYDAGANIFIEVGANATCTNWVDTILSGKEHLAISSNQKGKSDTQSIAQLLAKLISNDVEIDLSLLFEEEKQQEKKRGFYKKITPGGKKIYDILLSDEQQELFSIIKEKKQPAVQVLETVGEHHVVNNTTQHLYSNNNIYTKSYPVKTNAIPMDVNITDQISTEVKPSEKLGENGLMIHDFTTGEHLKDKQVVFSQQDLKEFANGKIGKVFGPDYNIIDSYKRRVMLPKDPYLLVSRVTKLNAKRGDYKPSTMQTEYDIPHSAWFTTDGQIPWAVSVESGQCDLLLISYLGIDFENKGDLVYRLLDCTLTFVDDLPFEGQTLRYDISINNFIRNGENLLFFFSYRCYVEDRLVLKMDNGCAGFFNDEQLQDGTGVIYSSSELELKQKVTKKNFTPFLYTDKKQFSKADLQHLITGDIEKCFGNESYFANGRNPSLRLPPEQILMLDRITSVDIKGGSYGLGYIEAEKDLHPDDWYFPCHFRDDEVLAGSLQAEGGGNLLRFFMLMLGLQRTKKDARFQPVLGLPQKVRCRKQVVPHTDTKLIYRLEIKEIGLIPNPYVVGDLEIISNGAITVHFENLGLQIREKDNPNYLDTTKGVKLSPRSVGALMNEKDVTTFALGSMVDCFGDDFQIYNVRKMSRQPNTDLQLISRVLKVDGERGKFTDNPTVYAEYDVPEDAWYYEQNSSMTMPYSMIMEIALQPCGLLGAYLGSTLQFPNHDLYLRNLDGEGETFALPSGTDFRGSVIHNKAVLTSSTAYGDTILQHYSFELSVDGELFYKGKSSFGFFTAEALAGQIGLDAGKKIPAWYITNALQPKDYMQIKLDSLFGKMKLFKAPDSKPHARLAGDQLELIDQLIIAENKGEYQKGYIHATKFVKPYDWYFACHFYQDPVMPGSLGVEAILQAMQVFALQQDLGREFKSPKFVQVPNHKTVWKYRGQILLPVKEMYLEVHIKSIEKKANQLVIVAEAFLWNDTMRIYQVTDIALGIEEAN